MPLSDEEFGKIKELWAEAYLSFQQDPRLCYLKLTEIGRIIGRHTKGFEEKMGLGKVEVKAIIQRKDGSVRKIQDYEFKNNRLVKRVIKEE